MKHQEQCGSCWTPTTTEYLVDCYWKSVGLERTAARELFTVDSACNGDLMKNGFVLAAKNTICTEASHSYACLATEGTCMEVQIAWKYRDVPTDSEQTLMSAVAQQHDSTA